MTCNADVASSNESFLRESNSNLFKPMIQHLCTHHQANIDVHKDSKCIVKQVPWT